MNMEKYIQRQVLLNNLKFSLEDLHEQKEITNVKLDRINKQIEKHENFIKKLEEEDNE